MAPLTDFYIKQGDTAEAIVVRAEYDNGDPITEDLTGATCEFHLSLNDGTVVVAAGSGDITTDPDDPTGPKLIGYQWEAGDTDDADASLNQPHFCEFEITLADGRVFTVPNSYNIAVHVFPEIA